MRLAAGMLFSLILATLSTHAADLEVVSVTPSKSTVATGERFTFAVRLRNHATRAARASLHMGAAAPYEDLFIEIVPPPGWRCTQTRFAELSVGCTAESMPPGEAELRATMLAPRVAHAEPYRFTAETISVGDPNFTNNAKVAEVTVVAAADAVDVQVSTPAATKLAVADQPLEADFTVANNGPAFARGLILLLETDFLATGITVIADGWTCEETQANRRACTRARLGPGESSMVRVRYATTLRDVNIESYSIVRVAVTSEGTRETDLTNDEAAVVFGFGTPSEWQMLLVPLTTTDVPGAFGSLWKTDFTMLFASDERFPVAPNLCVLAALAPDADLDRSVTCPEPPPVRRPFEARRYGYIESTAGTHFLYVRREDAAKLRINGRVYDASRTSETAGTELPIPRDTDFSTETLSLLNIPGGTRYRHTVRVYDGDGRHGARVAIRVYVNDEVAPRATALRALSVHPLFRITRTNAFLPYAPAVTQLDLSQLVRVEEAGTLRVDIQPLDAGLRLWGMVSITNNDTQQVTLVTPQ